MRKPRLQDCGTLKCETKRAHATKSTSERQLLNCTDAYPLYGIKSVVQSFPTIMTRETAPRSMFVLFLFTLIFGSVSQSAALAGGPAEAGKLSVEEHARKLVEAGETGEAGLLRQALEAHPADLDA